MSEHAQDDRRRDDTQRRGDAGFGLQRLEGDECEDDRRQPARTEPPDERDRLRPR
jgi:hypothetical protein